ncbi:pyruvoyl-dependent arginine decarboxylase [Candidatus Altiarchaeota archaeon]
MNYERFFLTKGSAVCKISQLNAFDKALLKAGVCQCNLVPVSSIIAPGSTEVSFTKIPAGSITHCVLASIEGCVGSIASAGVGLAVLTEDGVERYGIVAEDTGYFEEDACRENLSRKLSEMADARSLTIIEDSIQTRITSVSETPEGCFSHAIAALVYVE